MNRYKVYVDYVQFIFDEGEAALSFAEVARRHIRSKQAVVTIEIEEVEEDGR